jgi:hypothetical protein
MTRLKLYFRLSSIQIIRTSGEVGRIKQNKNKLFPVFNFQQFYLPVQSGAKRSSFFLLPCAGSLGPDRSSDLVMTRWIQVARGGFNRRGDGEARWSEGFGPHWPLRTK